MTTWQPMETAPKDRHILLRSADFGAVEGWWSVEVQNFYKSQEGWASYDPDNAQGDRRHLRGFSHCRLRFDARHRDPLLGFSL